MKKISLIVGILAVSLAACGGKKGASSGDEYGAGRINGLNTVYFDLDQATIRYDQASTLQGNAGFLKKNSMRVNVEGHCDERGTNEYNLALGDRRARTTKDYLVNLGIDPSRLNVMSFGEEKPTCYEHDESCFSRNRRAEFTK